MCHVVSTSAPIQVWLSVKPHVWTAGRTAAQFYTPAAHCKHSATPAT